MDDLGKKAADVMPPMAASSSEEDEDVEDLDEEETKPLDCSSSTNGSTSPPTKCLTSPIKPQVNFF